MEEKTQILHTKKKNRLSRFEKQYSKITSIVLKTGIWLLILSLGIILIKEFLDKTYTIEAFQVPKEFNDNGYNGRVLATKIFDQVQEIKRKGNTQKETNEFASNTNLESLNLELAGLGFSVKTFTHQLKKSLGYKNKIITGELTRLEDNLELTLRISGNKPYSRSGKISDNGLQGTLEDLIQKIAEQILLETEPYQLAVYYYYDNQNKKSVNLIYEIIRENEDDAKWAYVLWGNYYKDIKKDFVKAKEKYEKSIKLDPRFHLAYHNLGDLHVDDKQYDKAIEYLETSTALKPDYYFSWALLGSALFQNGQIEAAQEKFDKAYQLHPENAYLFRLQGDLYANAGDMDSALEKYNRGLEIYPYYEDLYGNLTFNLIQNGRFNEGLIYAKEAIEVFPDIAMGDGLAAYCYLGMNKPDSAKIHVDRVFEIDPEQSSSYAVAAIYHAAMKEDENFYTSVDSMLSKGFNMRIVFDVPFVRAYLDKEPFKKLAVKHGFKLD